MRTIKIKDIPVHIYSRSEWINKWGEDDLRYHGFYCPDNRDIHIRRRRDFKSMSFTWDEVLIHEYTHYLQHKKGKWLDFELILTQSLPITKEVKLQYPKEEWAGEAEARWIQKRPYLINW